MSNQQWQLSSANLHDYEFKIFSQFGCDGIIQYLIKHVAIKNRLFIEFGVEDFSESNCRFLMMNNHWSGLVMDGSRQNMERLRNRPWFWKYDLETKAVFIDCDNINELLADTRYTDIGILSIDIDGNDYHILKELDLARLNPSILILEYNSVFGNDRKITVPYDKHFYRTDKHYSNLYFGASLPALADLAGELQYALVGCNMAGNNAFFVRRDLLNDSVREVSLEEGYVRSTCKESRHPDGTLSYIGGDDRIEAIRGLDVLNIDTGRIEPL